MPNRIMVQEVTNKVYFDVTIGGTAAGRIVIGKKKKLCCTVMYCAVCCAVLCYNVPSCAVFCYAVLRCAMLCCLLDTLRWCVYII